MYHSDNYYHHQGQQQPQQQQPQQYQSGYGQRGSYQDASPSISSLPSMNGFNATIQQLPQLWMGELDQRWDEATIKQIWTSILGPMGIVIHSVKLIRDKQSTGLGLANAGYCFVKFHNLEDATRVLDAFNGKPIPGTNNLRYFRINWSSTNGAAPLGSGKSQFSQSQYPTPAYGLGTQQPREFSVFIGDLPQNITEPTLLQTFQSRYPSCSSVKIMIDPLTGNLKGYGFVKFLNEDEHKRALIEMQGYILMGRPIRVSTAAKSQSSATINTGNNNNNVNYNQGLQQSSLQPHQQQLQSQQPRLIVPPLPQSIPLQYYNDPNNTTVFIGGLNVPLTEMQLRELFSKYGDITYAKIPPSKNCGFVQYYHRASAEVAITEMQGYDIGGGCKIRVSWGARAAQRNWFARQLALQQQAQQAGTNSSLNALSSPTSSLLTPNSSITQLEMTNSLGLLGTNYNLLNDLLLPGSNKPYETSIGGASNPVTSDGAIGNPNSSSIGNFDNHLSTTADSVLNQEKLFNEPIPFSPINSSGGGSLENSITSDEFKLNEFLLAARDGSLDKLDMGSSIYKLH